MELIAIQLINGLVGIPSINVLDIGKILALSCVIVQWNVDIADLAVLFENVLQIFILNFVGDASNM